MLPEMVAAGVWVVAIALIIANIIAFCVAGALILKPVDKQGVGVALGFFLGPIGLVIAWAKRENELLERQEYKERHRAALDDVKSTPTPGARPSWAPDEAPRRFR